MKPLALLGLVGRKHSGKDTVFGCLESLAYENKLKAVPIRVAFADALKEEIAKELGTTVEYVNKHKKWLRVWLQEHGSMRREQMEDYWIAKIADYALNRELLYRNFTVITDVRHLNEAKWIWDNGGKLLRVRRKATDNSGDKHESETEVDLITCDGFVYNDEGLGRLKFMALDAVKELFQGKL